MNSFSRSSFSLTCPIEDDISWWNSNTTNVTRQNQDCRWVLSSLTEHRNETRDYSHVRHSPVDFESNREYANELLYSERPTFVHHSASDRAKRRSSTGRLGTVSMPLWRRAFPRTREYELSVRVRRVCTSHGYVSVLVDRSFSSVCCRCCCCCCYSDNRDEELKAKMKAKAMGQLIDPMSDQEIEIDHPPLLDSHRICWMIWTIHSISLWFSRSETWRWTTNHFGQVEGEQPWNPIQTDPVESSRTPMNEWNLLRSYSHRRYSQSLRVSDGSDCRTYSPRNPKVMLDEIEPFSLVLSKRKSG